MATAGMPYGLQAMLKDGYKHMSGVNEAVLKNLEACKELSKITRTSLGPNGARPEQRAQGRRAPSRFVSRVLMVVHSERFAARARSCERCGPARGRGGACLGGAPRRVGRRRAAG